tara:strand:+ start:1819 stop:3129 length:1311 start_codon:yes stop_codon:yes gene_type:complete
MALSKKLKALLEEDPEALIANQRLKAKDLYIHRNRFRDELPLTASNGDPFPYIDLWYERSLYGRIDHMWSPVYPSETNLVMIADDCMVLDFVAEAFRDFRTKWDTLINMGVVETVGLLKKLEPKEGWKSLHEKYHLHVEDLFSDFQSWVRDNNFDQKLFTFQDFLDIFSEYVAEKSPHTSFTRSSLITSSKIGVEYSGLMIGLNRIAVDHDADYGKQIGFFRDPNYELYALTAAQFGFYVDKNAPWRLIANINSVPMQQYMLNYGITGQSDLFNRYYYKARTKDMESLRPYLASMWNSFATSYPYQRQTKVMWDKQSQEYVTRATIKQRSRLTNADTTTVIAENWERLYFYVRAKEEGVNWNQSQFDRYSQNLVLAFRKTGETRARRLGAGYIGDPPSTGNPSHRISLDSNKEERYNTRYSFKNVGDFVLNIDWSR